MRNLTDEQAKEVALDLVQDLLRGGVEYLDVVEAVDAAMGVDEDDDFEDAEPDDYDAVEKQVNLWLDHLLSVTDYQ